MTQGVVPWHRHLLFWTIAILGAGFDLGTKAAVFERYGAPPFSPAVSILGDVLEIKTSYNDGALWGIGRGFPYVWAALSLVAAGFIIWWLFVRRHAADWQQTAALGLIMAGAIGNCYDRVALGHVRDFVHFHVDRIHFDFAIFNFADNMLVIGAIWVIILSFRPEQLVAQPKPHAMERAQATEAP
jgi:signal peptidase II